MYIPPVAGAQKLQSKKTVRKPKTSSGEETFGEALESLLSVDRVELNHDQSKKKHPGNPRRTPANSTKDEETSESKIDISV